MSGSAVKAIAGIFALAAFSVAILAGLAGGNAAASILMRALIAMILCYPVGLAVGAIAQRVVMDHIEAHRNAHPLPVEGGGDDTETFRAGAPESPEESDDPADSAPSASRDVRRVEEEEFAPA